MNFSPNRSKTNNGYGLIILLLIYTVCTPLITLNCQGPAYISKLDMYLYSENVNSRFDFRNSNLNHKSIFLSVDVEAKSSCTINSELTLKVNRKELSQPKKGLYILTLNTTNGGYKTTSFNQPMKHYFWDSDRRKKNKRNFINYFRSLPNNTVIVFVTKGLCKYSDFGDWITYLEKGTDLVFERKDYRGDWMSAVVVACKTNCPKDVRPITIYGQYAVLNVTFGTKGKQ